MPFAVIALDFDPVVRLGDLGARLQTLGIAVAILVGLVLAAWIAGATPEEGRDPGRFVRRPRLRRDDLLYVALAIVPGAVLGGRLGHGLVHLDYYLAHPAALADPSHGSLELAGAVVGGAIAGAGAAALLELPVRRWLHVAAIPMLVALAGGKLAMALGGDGQGAPSSVPWATVYLGAGPWASAAPAEPAHPAQLYEALTTLVAVLVVAILGLRGVFEARDGRAFLVAVGLWGLGRAIAATFWRDPAVLGPLNAGQLLALVLAAGSALVVLGDGRWAALTRGPGEAPSEPAWPDPASRPRF